MIADTKAQPSDSKLGKKLFQFMKYEILKIVTQKFKKVWLWLLTKCKDFFDHIFAYYDLPLPIGSDEIIKRHKKWLNNPQGGHKEGQQISFFLWDIFFYNKKKLCTRRLLQVHILDSLANHEQFCIFFSKCISTICRLPRNSHNFYPI